MPFSIKRTIYPLIVPAVLIILSALIIWKWTLLTQKVSGVKELRALFVILPVLPYVVLCIVFMMGWRYNNTGLILASVALAFSYLVLSRSGPEAVVDPSTHEAVAFLLPLNLVVFTMLTKRRLFSIPSLFCVIFVAFQILAVALVFHPAYSRLLFETGHLSPLAAKKLSIFLEKLRSVFHDNSFLGFEEISDLSIFAYSFALIFLLMRFLRNRDVILAAFSGAVIATFLAIAAGGAVPSSTIYFSTAGLVLIIATIEASFSMAYVDELTDLPSRRSLNQTLINLGKKYAIAMIDVDHFKKINDTYGHKTGDQVLRMIASGLREMSGGAKAFRYGGEEFTAIFPGKGVAEAVPHLEKYRKAIESIPFVVRGKGRRKSTSKNRGKGKVSPRKRARVTVSIGVAAPDRNLTKPEKVLKAADKRLYKAKKAGRNRLKS